MCRYVIVHLSLSTTTRLPLSVGLTEEFSLCHHGYYTN